MVLVFKAGGDDGDADGVFVHVFVFDVAEFEFGIRQRVFGNLGHDFFVFVENEAFGRGGDVDQHAFGAVEVDVVQKRAGNGFLHGDAGAVGAAGFADAHHRHAGDAHHVFDVGKIDVDQAAVGNDFGDAGHGVAQHVVGGAESGANGYAFAQRGEQFVVGHHDQRIDVAFEVFDAFLGDGGAAAFVFEGAGNHGHGQDAEFFGHFGDNRSGAGAGAAAHTGGDEQHIGAADQFGNRFAVFQRGVAADFGIGAGTQAAGQVDAELDFVFRQIALQRLGIGVGADVFDALDRIFDHVVDGVAAAAADADDFDDSRTDDGFDGGVGGVFHNSASSLTLGAGDGNGNRAAAGAA